MLEDNPSESVYLSNDYMWMLKPGHERHGEQFHGAMRLMDNFNLTKSVPTHIIRFWI